MRVLNQSLPLLIPEQTAKVIIFDFDGTIADSFDAVFKISNRLAAQFGYPPTSVEEANELKKLSSREILKRSKVPLFKLPFLIRRLRSELNREIARLEPIPGIKDALLELKRQGHHLGIVTSNSRQNVIAFLEAQDMRELFDFIESGLTLFGKGRIIQQILRQKEIAPAKAIYVGDETRDVEAARKIGIQVIAVCWGFNSCEVLAAQSPDFLIRRPADLAAVMAH
ncbi:HAD hydrolase-like protein [Stenomitos frigidus]|uniref:Carotenoid oxygenase n=1 Tax=Stenomitos frigidus ULC18 TaxID=2107698 RepID=A0A2T1E3J4_9CYAN|nr:HAD hydrolase-like protein [Stenomitos frigidus]PSB27323.1 carotenoid oxygenase [Stenomitos frigidus ULC18]